ncbi:MAG: glycoside hydrolase family 30 protein [Bacteroidales bacterium]
MCQKIYLLLLLPLLVSCGKEISWVSTTEKQAWQSRSIKASVFNVDTDAENEPDTETDMGIDPDELSENDTVTVKATLLIIDDQTTFQQIEGFGACFNELGWLSLSRLSEADRQVVMQELFEPGIGLNFTVCRMPVGANDFSRDWYSYNETAGDFEMKNFSLKNDETTLIPFIKAALKYNPDLKLWASPWSPPAWMKWNKHYACAVPWPGLDKKFSNYLPADKQGKEGTNMFIQEDAYFAAYAEYFARFIEAYRAQNINISIVMPQNEFNSCQIFPSCTWTAAGLAEFIGKYLGPRMKEKNVELMFGTMERANTALADTVLTDSLASQFLKGVGFQWAGKGAIEEIHFRYPHLKMWQTEQECGDGKNDWAYCTYAWSLMKHYLSNGAGTYLYWNISLDEGGFSRWGWQQNSLFTVDTTKNTVKFNHELYLMKHFSHFVQPGATRIATSGYDNALAFRNPDGSTILVVYNDAAEAKKITIQLGKQVIKPVLEAQSFNTFRF